MYKQLVRLTIITAMCAMVFVGKAHAQTLGMVEGCVTVAGTGSGSIVKGATGDQCDGSGIPNVKVWIKASGQPDSSAISATTGSDGYYGVFVQYTKFDVFLKNNLGDTGVTTPDAPFGFIPPGTPTNFNTVPVPHVTRRYNDQSFGTGCTTDRRDNYRGGAYRGCSFTFYSHTRDEKDNAYTDTNNDGIDDAESGQENSVGGIIRTKTGAYTYTIGKAKVPVLVCLDVPKFNAIKVVNGVTSSIPIESCKKVYTDANGAFRAADWVPLGRAYSVRIPNDATSVSEINAVGYINGSHKTLFDNGSASNPYGVNEGGNLAYNYLSGSPTTPGSSSYEGQFYGSNIIGFGHVRGCSKTPLRTTLYTQYPTLLGNTKTYNVIEQSTGTTPNGNYATLQAEKCDFSFEVKPPVPSIPAGTPTAKPTPTPTRAPSPTPTQIKYSFTTSCTGYSIKDGVTSTTILTALPAGSNAFIAGATTRYQVRAVGGAPSATYTAQAKSVLKDRIEFNRWSSRLKPGTYQFTVVDTVLNKVILTDTTTQPDFTDCNKCDAPTGISLVYDRTGSMKKAASSTDPKTYFEYEQAAMREFVDTLQNEIIARGFDNGDVQLSVTQFSGDPASGAYSDYNLNNSTELFRPTKLSSAPTTNYAAIKSLFTVGGATEIKATNRTGGGVSTCIECVLRNARRQGFSSGATNRNIVLLSDGEMNLLARVNGTLQTQKSANEFAISQYPTMDASLSADKAYFARTGTSSFIGSFSDTNWVYTAQRTVEQAKLVKQSGIKIYSVSYNPHTLTNIAAPAGSISTEQVMRDIATSPATFASAAIPSQWATIMDNIAKDICAPRIATMNMAASPQVVAFEPFSWFSRMVSTIRNAVSSFASGN